MKPSLRPGVSRINRIVVDRDRTIGFMGEEARTYATPSMILDIEHTCRELIVEHADAGEDSVGMEVAVRHLAPTLMGMTVEITVRCTSVDGRKVASTSPSRTSSRQVGAGSHTRFVVDKAKTLERLKAKAARLGAAHRRGMLDAGHAVAASVSCSIAPPRPCRATSSQRCSLHRLQADGRARLCQGRRMSAASSMPPECVPSRSRRSPTSRVSRSRRRPTCATIFRSGCSRYPREELLRIARLLGHHRQAHRRRLYARRSRSVVGPDGAFARLHGREARATSSTTPTATACSPAGSDSTTAPNGSA